MEISFILGCVLWLIASTADSGTVPVENDRIVGGEEANAHEFPWITMIRSASGEFCAGSIIGTEWVITAGHCSKDEAAGYTVTAGAHSISRPEGTEVVVNVAQKYTHPYYNPRNGDHDVALFRIYPAFAFNDHVKPIDLAPSDYVAQGESVVCGWGLTSEHAQGQPDILRKVTIPIVDLGTCQRIYSSLQGAIAISIATICAGDGSAGKSACYGDSGGPLHCQSPSNPIGYLCGTVSGGKRCGEVGIYRKVSYYRDWISAVTQGLYSHDEAEEEEATSEQEE